MLIQNKVNIGLGINVKVAPCLLQSPSPEMLCDDVRRVKSTGHAAEQCPVERTWTGATSQEDARGQLTTWSYKPNYLQFFFWFITLSKAPSLLHPDETPQISHQITVSFRSEL